MTDTAGVAIPYANIQINGAAKTVADNEGKFRLGVPKDAGFTIEIRRIGYEPATAKYSIVPDSDFRIALVPIVRKLEATQVVAERTNSLALHGFYERMLDRQRGTLNGYFITPEDIERRNPARASQMIEDVPGLRIAQKNIVNRQPFPFLAFGSDGCLATVYVNGTRINLLTGSKQKEMMSVIFDDIVEPASLAGIEVYTRGTRAPGQYQGLNGSCAVVLIWTK